VSSARLLAVADAYHAMKGLDDPPAPYRGLTKRFTAPSVEVADLWRASAILPRVNVTTRRRAQ
jgi:hypothetical protein